jgi:hypothetical protein
VVPGAATPAGPPKAKAKEPVAVAESSLLVDGVDAGVSDPSPIEPDLREWWRV